MDKKSARETTEMPPLFTRRQITTTLFACAVFASAFEALERPSSETGVQDPSDTEDTNPPKSPRP